MRMICQVFLFILLAALPTSGETAGLGQDEALESSLRTAVDAGDIAALERIVGEAQTKALATHDHEGLRQAFRRIFGTTSLTREKTLVEWAATMPDSVYAHTALAEMYYWHAFAYNLDPSSDYVPRRDDFLLQNNLAILESARAVAINPAFLRATDLALFAAVNGPHAQMVADITARAMAAEPNADTVRHAAWVVGACRSDCIGGVFKVCAELAPKVRGYSPEQCIIEAILDGHVVTDTSPIYKAAHQAALQSTSTRLARYRSAVILELSPDGLDPQEVFAQHLAALNVWTDLSEWKGQADDLARRYANSIFSGVALKKLRAELDQRLIDDPRNPKYLLLISNIGDIPPMTGDRATDATRQRSTRYAQLWRDAMPYGKHSATYWMLGSVDGIDRVIEPEAYLATINNAFVASNNSAFAFDNALWFIGITEDTFAHEGFKDEAGTPRPVDAAAWETIMACPKARIAIVYDAVCEAGELNLCALSSPGFSKVKGILDEVQAGKLCPELKGKDALELAYTTIVPVPGHSGTDSQP